MKSYLILILGLFLCISSAHADNETGYYVEALQPTSFITYQGKQIALYESTGTKGPGILLVHGNTSSANSFLRVMQSHFANKYKVAAVDLPGYGQSEDAASYDIAYFTGAIVAAAQATGADDGVLVGWSLGGDLILQASSQLPNVKGYFTFGTTPINADPNLPPPFLTAQQSYAGAAVDYGVIGTILGTLSPIQISDYVNAFFRPNYGRIPRPILADGFRTDPATRDAVLIAATGGDPNFQDEVAIVQNLAVPIAFVVGKQDAFINPDRLDALESTIPNLYSGEIIYLPFTGHAVQYERPTLFNHLLRNFVKNVD